MKVTSHQPRPETWLVHDRDTEAPCTVLLSLRTSHCSEVASISGAWRPGGRTRTRAHKHTHTHTEADGLTDIDTRRQTHIQTHMSPFGCASSECTFHKRFLIRGTSWRCLRDPHTIGLGKTLQRKCCSASRPTVPGGLGQPAETLPLPCTAPERACQVCLPGARDRSISCGPDCGFQSLFASVNSRTFI